MSIFVESLKRLYANYRITKESVIELFEKQKITEEEKIYISQISSSTLNKRSGIIIK